jgi:phosphoribosylamine--glycine ligase
MADNQLVTNGGRILSITSYGKNIKEAIGRSIAIAENISYEGKYYRTDIGKDLM